MTLTETRPTEAAADATAPPVERGIAAIFATGDHKLLGRLFGLGGIVATVAACVAAALFALPANGDGSDFFVRADSRLTSAAAAFAFVIGIPALWIGLATYVTPLQIGGHRLAMPRLHAFALWLYLGGSILVAIAYVADETRLSSLASSVPPAANGRATDAVLLLIGGLALVAIATMLAAGNLFATILNRRGEGFRLLYIPAFSWSVLSTSLVLLLATPVFLAGLILLYLDQRYGGTLLSSPGLFSFRIWEHELWLLGRPEALLFFAAGIGIYSDIVSSVLRRPLALYPLARASAAATPLLALFGWVGATSLLNSPFPPFGTVLAVLVAVPALLSVLTWAASFPGSRPRVIGGALPFLAHFVIDGLLIAVAIAAALGELDQVESAFFRNGQVTLFMLGQVVLGLAAGYLYWTPKLRGRVPSMPQAAATTLLLLGGAVLMAAPGYIVGLGGDDVPGIAIGGAVVFSLGLLSLLGSVVGPAGNATSDPYEAFTLEWATASPPVRHNFDEIPDIRSPYPMYDARVDAGATTTEAQA